MRVAYKWDVLPALAAKIASRIIKALQPRLMFMTFGDPGSSRSRRLLKCDTNALPYGLPALASFPDQAQANEV